jgi:hypothetical protein
MSHRDLAPATVMAGAFGDAPMMDWGIAMVWGGMDGLSASGTQNFWKVGI